MSNMLVEVDVFACLISNKFVMAFDMVCARPILIVNSFTISPTIVILLVNVFAIACLRLNFKVACEFIFPCLKSNLKVRVGTSSADTNESVSNEVELNEAGFTAICLMSNLRFNASETDPLISNLFVLVLVTDALAVKLVPVNDANVYPTTMYFDKVTVVFKYFEDSH